MNAVFHNTGYTNCYAGRLIGGDHPGPGNTYYGSSIELYQLSPPGAYPVNKLYLTR